MNVKVILFIFLFLLGQFVVAQIDLDSGLVAHFSFTANAADSSGNGNHGTVNGPILTQDRFGNPNSAYDFDGVDDFIDINSNTNMSPTEAVSIAAWIKADPVAKLRFIYDRIEVNDGYGLDLTANGILQLSINGAQQSAFSSQIVADGQWHHAVGTYDKNAGQLKIYVDGIEDGSASFSSPITYTPEPRNGIGGPGGSSNYFKGAIDELRVYTRALSSCEIAELYSKDTVNVVNSITEALPQNEDFTIYPNPSHDMITIEFENLWEVPDEIKITDLNGRLITHITDIRAKQTQVNTSHFEAGIYLIQSIGSIYFKSKHLVIIK